MIFSVYGRLKDCDRNKKHLKRVSCKNIKNSEGFYKRLPLEVIIYYLYSIYFINLYACIALHLFLLFLIFFIIYTIFIIYTFLLFPGHFHIW